MLKNLGENVPRTRTPLLLSKSDKSGVCEKADADVDELEGREEDAENSDDDKENMAKEGAGAESEEPCWTDGTSEIQWSKVRRATMKKANSSRDCRYWMIAIAA